MILQDLNQEDRPRHMLCAAAESLHSRTVSHTALLYLALAAAKDGYLALRAKEACRGLLLQPSRMSHLTARRRLMSSIRPLARTLLDKANIRLKTGASWNVIDRKDQESQALTILLQWLHRMEGPASP